MYSIFLSREKEKKRNPLSDSFLRTKSEKSVDARFSPLLLPEFDPSPNFGRIDIHPTRFSIPHARIDPFYQPSKEGEGYGFRKRFQPVQSSAEPRTKPDVLRAKIPPVRINVSHYFRVKSRINNDGSLYRVVSRLDHSRYRWRRKGRKGKIKKRFPPVSYHGGSESSVGGITIYRAGRRSG